MRVLLSGILCALSAFPASQPVRETLTQAIAAGGQRIVQFRHGYLVALPNGPAYSFAAFAPDGRLAFDKPIELPGGGSQSSVGDVDFDTDGTAVVAASAIGGTPCMLHGVLILDRTGRQIRFIDTGCYIPTHIAFAPDHSIWTLGWQRDVSGTEEDRQDYMIIRQFTIDGKQLSAALPRSSFPKGLGPGSAGDELRIEVTRDRVGVLVYSGNTSLNREWIELDLNGRIIERLRIDSVVRSPASVAFTADDHVYLQGADKGTLFTIATVLQALKPVPNQGASLMGADDNNLVYRQACCGLIQLQWFHQP
jgi:hypothetical protein